jgi:hypothetical protein
LVSLYVNRPGFHAAVFAGGGTSCTFDSIPLFQVFGHPAQFEILCVDLVSSGTPQKIDVFAVASFR